MTFKNCFVAAAAILFCSIQSCKKDEPAPEPDPVPVIKPDTLGTGWVKKPFTSVYVSDIFFNSPTTGYLLADHIYKSTDGGNNWTQTSSPSVPYNMFMTNDNKAFFVGNNNSILKTFDGGNTFTNSTTQGETIDVFFSDNNNGYCITSNGFCTTTDGGVSWQMINTPGLTGAVGAYSSLFFLNNTTGWVVNRTGVFKASGSPLTWQQATVTGGSPAADFSAVYATSANIVYLANHGAEIFKSTNGGSTFSLIKDLDGGYTDIYFLNDLVGYASSGRWVYKTTDGGANWTKEVSLGEGTILEVHFTDANHGWACGSDGIVLIYNQ